MYTVGIQSERTGVYTNEIVVVHVWLVGLDWIGLGFPLKKMGKCGTPYNIIYVREGDLYVMYLVDHGRPWVVLSHFYLIFVFCTKPLLFFTIHQAEQ